MSDCGAFLRPQLSPYAALTFAVVDGIDPGDWPTVQGAAIIESQLGHAAGWGCEVRAEHIILLDPLGEGVLKAERPKLSEAWIHQIRATNSAAIFLVPALDLDQRVGDADRQTSEWATAALAGSDRTLRAATVRTSISDDAFAPPKVGRNDPCHCGSGKKFKVCHGRK